MALTRHLISTFAHFILLVRHLVADFARLAALLCRSRGALAAENLLLRKQLALFQERKVKLHRATDATRFVMVLLGRFFDWRSTLVVVKPDTLIRWHRKGFRLFWRWKSTSRGRLKLPANLRGLILEMAAANPIWGEARIADELLLKLGIRVAPRAVGKYLSGGFRPGRTPDPQQRWMTFVRNHAKAIVACDFFVVVTATFPSSMFSWSWKLGRAESCTAMSRPIRQRNGLSSNFVRRCRATTRTALRSMTVIGSARRIRTRP